MSRILIIGSGGAGKSTLARRLGGTLGVDVIHLDSLYWRPGWEEPPKSEWSRTVDDMIQKRSWIMDGNYSGTLEKRLVACNVVIFLDLPRSTCVWRVVKRAFRYRHQTRPDMAAGCPEHLTLQFILWIWNYPSRTRPKILRMLEDIQPRKTVFRLQSQAEIDRLLANAESLLKKEAPSQ
jgi:adenylate kinase family enzyme